MTDLWLRIRAVPGWILPLALALVVLVLPLLGSSYSLTRQIELTVIMALIVSGLNLSLGYAGELAMGQVAMYAAGAYATGLVAKAGVTEIWLQLLIGAGAALIVGLLSGIPGLRLGGWSLAMVSFFLILITPDILSVFKGSTGGRNGLSGIPRGTFFGEALDSTAYYMVIVGVGILWFVIMRNFVVSRHGNALRVLKQSPVLASSIGISVFRTKLLAYALGALPAGLAGTLFANLDLFISPEAFAFSFAMMVLAASIFGGSASIYGAVIGAIALQFAGNQATNYREWGLILTGAFLVFGGVAFSGGISSLVRGLVRRLDYRAGMRKVNKGSDVEPTVPAMPGALLKTSEVTKRFGGLTALNKVEFEAHPGKVTALIGPNGSGKTTLLNMISGFYRTDAGTILLDGNEIQGMSAHAVAREGVARTFQTPNIPENLSVLEAVEAGRYAHERASVLSAVLRTPGFRRTRRQDRAEAERVLGLVGLGDQIHADADSLPLGHRRLLEVARSLVSNPRVLLLDEVASGLDEDELDVLAALILRLRDAGMTVVLVEHNFPLVLKLADEIFVLALGNVIARGDSAEIEHNERVKEEYLGVTAEDEDEVIGVAGGNDE